MYYSALFFSLGSFSIVGIITGGSQNNSQIKRGNTVDAPDPNPKPGKRSSLPVVDSILFVEQTLQNVRRIARVHGLVVVRSMAGGVTAASVLRRWSTDWNTPGSGNGTVAAIEPAPFRRPRPRGTPTQ